MLYFVTIQFRELFLLIILAFKNVESLRLGRNGFTEKTLECYDLDFSNLKLLDLSNNIIGANGVDSLKLILSDKPSLETLALNCICRGKSIIENIASIFEDTGKRFIRKFLWVWIGTSLQKRATWRRRQVLRAKINTRLFSFARGTCFLRQVARFWSDVPITAHFCLQKTWISEPHPYIIIEKKQTEKWGIVGLGGCFTGFEHWISWYQF